MKLCALLLASTCLNAEFLSIEQKFGAMDCASCATFVENKLARNRGVESVKIDAAAGVLTVKLKSGNSVRYSQVRDFVQQSGYKPEAATVVVRGVVSKTESGWTLEISGSKETLSVEGKLRDSAGKEVELAGVIERAAGKTVDTLSVASVR